MNNNINKYIGKSGRYSPKMSDKRKHELKESGTGGVKALTHADIWALIVRDCKALPLSQAQ